MARKSFGILFIFTILYGTITKASIYCEGHCRAYWETVSSVLSSGSNMNEAVENARRKCRDSGGLVRSSADCINHSSYYNCSLVCNYPNGGETSTSSYGDTIHDAGKRITAYCQSYYSSYANQPYFRVSTEVGACR